MSYSIKKPSAMFWTTNRTREEVESDVHAGRIGKDWLICPLGEADRALTIDAFMKDSSLLKPKVFTHSEEPDHPPLPASTTSGLPGSEVDAVKGVVCGEAIMDTSVIRELAANWSDMVGGRSRAYEGTLKQGRENKGVRKQRLPGQERHRVVIPEEQLYPPI